jgi:hypothetical protein
VGRGFVGPIGGPRCIDAGSREVAPSDLILSFAKTKYEQLESLNRLSGEPETSGKCGREAVAWGSRGAASWLKGY